MSALHFGKVTLLMLLLSGLFTPRDSRGETPDARGSLERGLKFLVTDAAAWRAEYQCASCHHVPMMTWALHEASSRGLPIDQAALDDQLAWLLDPTNPSKILPIAELTPEQAAAAAAVPGGVPPPPGPRLSAQYAALAAISAPVPTESIRAGWLRMARHILAHQSADGSLAPMMGRVPVFLSQQENTLQGWLALSPSPALLGDDAELAAQLTQAKARMDQWLAQQQPETTTQAMTFQLLVETRRATPLNATTPAPTNQATIDALRAKLLAQQHADGGWGQTSELPSDAAATGQALYALGSSGPVPAAGDAITRGVAFLLSTQQADGSWPMTSRPFGPNNDGAENLIPIIHFGSAWAVMGMVKTLPDSAD